MSAAQTVSQQFQLADVYNQSFNVQQRFGKRDVSEGSMSLSLCESVCVLSDPLDASRVLLLDVQQGM